MSGDIYFCLCGATNTVKIGHSRRVQNRVRHIDATSPFGVTLMATVPATLRDERELHRGLGKFRTMPNRRTEWYFWNREIHQLVEIAKGGATASELIASAYEMTGAERQEMGRTEFSCERCGDKFLRCRRDVLAGQTRFCTNLCATRATAAKRVAANLTKQIEEAYA